MEKVIEVGRKLFEKYTPKEVFENLVVYESINTMLEDVFIKYENQIFLGGEHQKTYKEMESDISHFRAVLKQKGVKKGDFVCLYSPNSYEFIKSFFAIVTLGACAVLLPPHLDERSIFGLMSKYESKTIVYSKTLEEKINAVMQIGKNFVYINADETSEETAKMADVKGEDNAVIIFTGGTTGRSKGALLTHRSLMLNVRNACLGIEQVYNQKLLLILPLTHVFGLVRNLLYSVATGTTMFICSVMKDMFKDIAMYKPTVLVIVPAIADMALNLSKMFGKNMFGDSVKLLIVGAAPTSSYIIEECLKLGIKICQGYGLTETANLVSGNPISNLKPGSVGLPYPDQSFKVVDDELWIKGDAVTKGYYKEDFENKNAFSEDGYFKTGDLVKFDEEGFLYITGRIKEIIVLQNGENISPNEYETKINECIYVESSLLYLDENNELALQVFLRKPVIATLKVENVNEFVTNEIKKVCAKFPSFVQVKKIIIRDSDFKRSKAMKILRSSENYDMK